MKPEAVKRIPKDAEYITGNDYAARDGFKTYAEWLNHWIPRQIKRGLIDAPPSGKTTRTVKARLEQERWLADCPDPDCRGACLVEFDDPVFFCMECGNAKNNSDYFRVEFPDVNFRAQIYSELEKRPIRRPPNRNKIMRAELSKGGLHPMLIRSWDPGEKINDLKQQREFIEERAKGKK